MERQGLTWPSSNPEPPPETKNAAPSAKGHGAHENGKRVSYSEDHINGQGSEGATPEYARIGLIWSVRSGTYQLFGHHGRCGVESAPEGEFTDPGEAFIAACMLMNLHPNAPLSVARIGGLS